jgi:hypothetical protein
LEPLTEERGIVPNSAQKVVPNNSQSDNIVETSETCVRLDPTLFLKAWERFAREAFDSMKFEFEKTFGESEERKFDNYLVARALGSFEQDGATKSELLSEIRKTERDYPAENLNNCLNQFAVEERGSIIPYSRSSGKAADAMGYRVKLVCGETSLDV